MQPAPRHRISAMAAALRISLLKLITISLALLCAASMPGLAQEWPAKTVRILVPFGPGSTPNIVARLIAEGLTKKYPDSTFLVENKPGASGNLATDVVAKAAPNGATLGISIGGPLAINTLLFSNLPTTCARISRPSRSSSRSRACSWSIPNSRSTASPNCWRC